MVEWAALLRPPVRRIVEALLAEPRTLSELAEGTGLSKPSLLRQLRDLEAIGLVVRTQLKTAGGREVQFALQPAGIHLDIDPRAGIVRSWATVGPQPLDFPLVGQVPDPSLRTDLVELLRGSRVAHDREPTTFVIVFGSVARGEATWKSDIDVMFVVPDDAPQEVREGIGTDVADIQSNVEHAISPRVVDRSAFLAGRRALEREAAKEGMIVFGPAREVEIWKKMERYKAIAI